MKTVFTAIFILAMMVFIVAPSQSIAQSGTLVVYASGDPLDVAIGGDTTSSGLQNHSVYQLVSLDTTYIFDATITLRSAVQILGVPDPATGKLPTIQPDVLSDNTSPGTFFQFAGQGTRNTVKNIYFLGLAINNVAPYGVALSLLADSISLTADNLVFDDFTGDAFSYQAAWVKLYISNCKMRNSINSTADYYEGEFIRNQNGVGAFKTDTIIVRNSTLNCVAAYVCAATGGITNYLEFSHCNVITTFKNPFFLDRATNAKFNDNIFYNAYCGGTNRTEFTGGWDSFTAGTLPSLITMGPLDSTTASILLGHASTGPGDPAAELLRKVEVKNNVYYWSKDLTDFYTAWNDTATVDTVYTPVWMNSQTINMFTDHTKWPGFVESGNQNVDPGFGTSINASLHAGTGYGNGLLGYFAAVRSGTGTTETYGCQITSVPQPLPSDWTPIWPLPEAADMNYSNASLKTGASDGGMVGDSSWLHPVVGINDNPGLVNKFSLSEAYPNPFNPSTSIKFNISQAGNVRLIVYNALGQIVKTLINNEYKQAGEYNFRINMSNFASGVYLYRLEQGSNAITKKMVLLK